MSDQRETKTPKVPREKKPQRQTKEWKTKQIQQQCKCDAVHAQHNGTGLGREGKEIPIRRETTAALRSFTPPPFIEI